MNDQIIARAVEVLRRGGLVSFPTETVYGLGADALNARAVERIFEVKGRPGTNPLIVHVADAATARRYAEAWPVEATWLAERFWPGPLTLILPKQHSIPDVVTAGRPTVGLRVPRHPVALELLKAFDGPVAAPSANRSTRVSPTSAQHVRDELGDAVDLILDGGACDVGIESTVLDLSVETPTILRPGSITREEIEREIGPVAVFGGSVAAGVVASSPGQHAVHYAPRARAYRFAAEQRDQMRSAALRDRNPSHVYLFLGEMPGTPEQYARELYRTLRSHDEQGASAMFIEMPPDTAEWAAVRDRLTRATVPAPDL
jgi:L-threonylcarbamoyladenylate synthase